MKVTQIPFQQTGFFSKTMSDYLDRKDTIREFYHNFPDKDGFRNQIEEKKNFSSENRKVLVNVLEDQYNSVHVSDVTLENIQSLKE